MKKQKQNWIEFLKKILSFFRSCFQFPFYLYVCVYVCVCEEGGWGWGVWGGVLKEDEQVI